MIYRGLGYNYTVDPADPSLDATPGYAMYDSGRLAAHEAAAEAEEAGYADLSAKAMDVVRYSDVTYQRRQDSQRQRDSGEPSLLSRMVSMLTAPRTAPAAGGRAQAKNSLISYGVPIAAGAVALIVISSAMR